jgi:hypothetical protein
MTVAFDVPWSLLLPALTGGLAGSIITLSAQSFLRRWNRPILRIVTTESGCNVINKRLAYRSRAQSIEGRNRQPPMG